MAGPESQVIDERTSLLANEQGAVTESDTESINAIEHKKTLIWTVFPVLLAGVFLSNVVSSVVLATNQHIASEFNALASATWLLTTYTLAQSASQPLYGRLSDIFGRRRCLVFCWAVFGVGCLLSGWGTKFWQVLLGRAISGIGSAGKIALTSVVVADIVPLKDVAAYRAYVNLTATTARSLGGPVGGWLAGTVGWRWPFVVQLPLALAGLVVVMWKLPEPSREKPEMFGNGEFDGTENLKVSPLARIDFAGAASLVATCITGMLALDLASKDEYSWKISLAMTAAFAIFLLLFIHIEQYHAKEPILPLSLVARRDVVAAYLVIALQSAAQFGLLYSIPIYFQVAMHESVSRASTRIVPVVIGNALGTVLSGRFISRTKRYKIITAFANCTGFTGFTLLLLRWRGNTNPAEALYVALPGVGMGIVQSSTFVHLAASVDRGEIAIAGTAWFLAQNVGVLIGASLRTALTNSLLKSDLKSALADEHGATEMIKRIMSNVGSIRALPDRLAAPVIRAYIRSLLASHGLSMAFLFFAFLVTMSIREKKM